MRSDKALIGRSRLALLDHLVIKVADGNVGSCNVDSSCVIVILVGGVVCPADEVAAVYIDGLVINADRGSRCNLIIIPRKRSRRIDVAVSVNENDLALCISLINVKTVADICADFRLRYVQERESRP